MTSKKMILLDADVVIHFTKGNQLGILTQYYSGRLLILQEVLEELTIVRESRTAIDNLLSYGLVTLYKSASLHPNIMREYARIRKLHKSDSGETMCMAVARFEDQIIASSNRKDIDSYCKEHSITYMTTLDILYELYVNELIDEADFDLFIYNVTSRNSKLSHKTLQDYKSKL